MMDRQENILDQFPAQSSGMDYAFLTALERRSAHGKAHLSSLQSAGDVLASLRNKQQAEQT